MSAEEDTGATVTPPERLAIGISFGNSYSSIANVSADGKPTVIANEDGDRQIPSVLSYIDGEEYHGVQAKSQLVRNRANTVAFFRDFIGKNFDAIDPTPCQASAHVQKKGENGVAFSIHDTTGEEASIVPVEEIAARHLRRLGSSASNFLGDKVNAAVITVPTNFSEAQKKVMAEAAEKAGIEVLQFISEPVAAILAYDARSNTKVEDKFIVVADLGGTRSDVAVVASRGGMYTILSTAHDYEFAGQKLDGVLIDHFAKEFIKKHKTDPREDARGLAKLRLECEATKKALSIGTNAGITIESLANGIDFNGTINRTRYELLANKILGGISRLIESTVKKADLDPLDITEIILAGGTSHTPRIASNLATLFPKSKILASSTEPTALNPSELVSRGAAIQASLIQEFDAEDIDQSAHPMVTATPHLRHAVGVLLISEDESRGVFQSVLAPETAVPVKRTVVCGAPKDGGNVLVKLCEGVADIKVTQPAKPNGNAKAKAKAEGIADENSDEDDESEEDEPMRERIYKAGPTLAETSVRNLKSGDKVEITVNVNAEMSLQMTARAVGQSSGVRVTVDRRAKAVVENGTA
jgi:molecular chaperone DnaK (HSP70)